MKYNLCYDMTIEGGPQEGVYSMCMAEDESEAEAVKWCQVDERNYVAAWVGDELKKFKLVNGKLAI